MPRVQVTSCRGLLINDSWLTHNKEYAVGLWGICDDAGAYTTLHITERPTQRAQLRDLVLAEVARALKLREGDRPSFAILLGSPGDEEVVLDGLQAALGAEVPILGGSAADNDGSGAWMQVAWLYAQPVYHTTYTLLLTLLHAYYWLTCCLLT